MSPMVATADIAATTAAVAAARLQRRSGVEAAPTTTPATVMAAAAPVEGEGDGCDDINSARLQSRLYCGDGGGDNDGNSSVIAKF